MMTWQTLRNIIVLTFIFTNSFATDWYLSTSGSNSNSGTSSGSPKKNFSALTISNGDNVYFKRGDHWDDEIIYLNTKSNITISDYGTGALPIITAYDTLIYQSVSSNIYRFYHADLNVDYYRYLPYRSRDGWKRFENNYCFLLDNNRNHYEMGRYQADGVYSEITNVGDSSTYFYCSSLSGDQPDNYHNGASGKVQTEAWTAESFLVSDWTSSGGKFDVSNLVSSGSIKLNGSSSYDHQIFLYNHRSYLNQNNEWASNNGTNERDGEIWIYNNTDISGANYFQSVNDSVVGLWNTTNITISNIEFHGGNAATIILYGCDSIMIDSCVFRYGHVGVFSDDGDKLYVRYDSLYNFTNMGVFDQSGNKLNIENTYMHDIGTSEGGGGDGDVSFNGIFSRFPDGPVTITGCHIDSCGRNGIHIKGDQPNNEYLIEYNHIEKYTTYVQDAAAYYISGSDGNTSSKVVRNNIASSGQYANDAFHCRNTTNHSAYYLDTDTYDVEFDSCISFDAHIAFKFNGTWENRLTNCLSVNHTVSGIRFVDYNYGHFGTGTVDCEFYNNKFVTNDPDAYGYNYNTWCCSVTTPTYYFGEAGGGNAQGTDTDSNSFASPVDATDESIGMERWYSAFATSLDAWVDTTGNELGAANAWEANSKATFVNHYASVSGLITQSQSVIGIANATGQEQIVDLYDLVFYDIDSNSISGTLTLQPYKGQELIYASGTADSIQYLPYVIGGAGFSPTTPTYTYATDTLEAEEADFIDASLKIYPGPPIYVGDWIAAFGTDWIRWDDVIFESTDTISISIAIEPGYANYIYISIDSVDDANRDSFLISSTGGWETFVWRTFALGRTIDGTHDLYITSLRPNIDKLTFNGLSQQTTSSVRLRHNNKHFKLIIGDQIFEVRVRQNGIPFLLLFGLFRHEPKRRRYKQVPREP